MQKFLRRYPCSGGPILCSSPDIFTQRIALIPIGFKQKNPTSFTPLMPSAATASHLRSSGMTTAIGGGNASFSFGNGSTCSSSPRFASNSSFRCRNCRCSIDNSTAGPGRAWAAFKENRSGSRVAWFHTSFTDKGVSASALKCEDNSDNGVGDDEKTMKFNRRHRGTPGGGSNAPLLLPGNPDLLTIPGVGPRNLRKLVENGIGGVAELKKIYKDKFFGKSNQKMVEFLRSSVGIIHKNHAESITTFIKESVDEELKDDHNITTDTHPSQKKRLTFCVEGNISVGKSTFLQRIANETLELQDLVEIVPEPIDKWQDIGPDHFNILDAFYAEPQRYAYTFQNYVFVTRVMQEKESSSGLKPLRLMERSVFSDRMVFVRAVHEANWMNEMEISIYDSWFDPVVSSLPGLIPDAFIYLRASPDTCHKRMMLRKRTEEGGVSLEYLRDLHEKHESWLFPFESGNHGTLAFSNPPLHMDSSLHPDIKDRVFYLEGNHMHSSIQKVPALVLDCEPTIDFNKDIEAKQQYARQVAEFFEYVKKVKEVPSAKDIERGKKGQVLLPHAAAAGGGGLWVPPQGKSFPDSLNSLDFRRAMSLMPGSASA